MTKDQIQKVRQVLERKKAWLKAIRAKGGFHVKPLQLKGSWTNYQKPE